MRVTGCGAEVLSRQKASNEIVSVRKFEHRIPTGVFLARSPRGTGVQSGMHSTLEGRGTEVYRMLETWINM